LVGKNVTATFSWKPAMLCSSRLASKVKRIVSVAQQLSPHDASAIEECCYDLLASADEEYLSDASILNNDGVPLQLCLTSSSKEARLRIIADPGASIEQTEARYLVSAETIRRAVRRGNALELAAACDDTIALLLPMTAEKRSSYSKGFAWIAASPGRPGMAFYVEMAPLGHEGGWEGVNRWLQHVLPTGDAATATLATIRRHCVVASAGLEGSTFSDARAKVYFRFPAARDPAELQIGVFSSAEMQNFLELINYPFGVGVNGLVMSLGFSMATGALVDAKLDVCGHCLTHTLPEWAAMTRAITDRFSLIPLDLGPLLRSEDCEVAFIGLGVTVDQQVRLNLYLKHSVRTVAPEIGEIEDALADGIRYLCWMQHEDGSWSDFDLPVGHSDQWVTAYVAHVLAQAGNALSIDQAKGCSLNGAAWLLRSRPYRAGWGFNKMTGPDSDSTAIAIALLDELSIPVADDDRSFLREHWRDDEGFATYHEPAAWAVGHWDVTPWGYLGLSPEDQARYRGEFLTALAKNRIGNRFWRSYWWRNPYYATLVTLEVLDRLRIRDIEWARQADEASIHFDNAFDLACYLGIEFIRDPFETKTDIHLRDLLNRQDRHGGWLGAANLRVTDPSCYEPWKIPKGAYYKDHLGLFTTATAVRVLTRIVLTRKMLQPLFVFAQ
jgi:hypothetical protein